MRKILKRFEIETKKVVRQLVCYTQNYSALFHVRKAGLHPAWVILLG